MGVVFGDDLGGALDSTFRLAFVGQLGVYLGDHLRLQLGTLFGSRFGLHLEAFFGVPSGVAWGSPGGLPGEVLGDPWAAILRGPQGHWGGR